jgi:pimeloyl-ACP methyl ester carboxylesterase
MTIELMGVLVPGLASSRQVIAVELQGHGHTPDIDRPITYEHLADDTAALLRYLGLETADVYGYSLGGGAALQLAMRHPALVRKLVLVSASRSSDGVYPEVLAGIEHITPELFDGTPWRAAYDRTAPDPAAFTGLVAKLKQLDATPFDWPAEAVRAIDAPTMIVVGDADGTRLEHAVEMFHLLGGGVFGDLAHRWRVSYDGATHSVGAFIMFASGIALLLVVARARPRPPLVDAMLVAVALSFVVNDTPQDVALWGSLGAIALLGFERSRVR